MVKILNLFIVENGNFESYVSGADLNELNNEVQFTQLDSYHAPPNLSLIETLFITKFPNSIFENKNISANDKALKPFIGKTIRIPDAVQGILLVCFLRDLTISRLRNMFRECNLGSTQHMGKWQNKSISIRGEPSFEKILLLCI